MTALSSHDERRTPAEALQRVVQRGAGCAETNKHTWRFGTGLCHRQPVWSYCGPCAAALEWHDGEYATSGPEHNLATRGGKYVKVYACDWGQGGRGWGGGGGWWQLTMATLTSTPPSKAASTPATSPVLAQSISASWHTKRGVEPCSHLPKARADTMDTQRPTMCPTELCVPQVEAWSVFPLTKMRELSGAVISDFRGSFRLSAN